MRKVSLLIIMCFICFTIIGCGRTDYIKEYTGSKIIKLTHISIDYMGGYTIKDELDLDKEKIIRTSFLAT